MATVTLGYWKFRGLAQTARLLLSYTNTPFDEKIYEFSNKEQWFEHDKQDLGLEFPNLPYLIDGDFKLTESAAIFKYIIRRSGQNELLGKDIQDEGAVDNISGVIADAFKEIRTLIISPNWAEQKAAVLEKVRPKFDYLKKFIGEREFALGYLTLVDFILSEILYFFETIYPEERANYAFWWRIRHNFEKLPGIKAYYQRPDAISEPFGPSAFMVVQPKFHKVKLGYWGIRGLAQVPRLLLSYFGVDFEDYLYTDRDVWFSEDKVNLGLNFPNLPYLIDGEYSITETAAILRYIIEKWGNKELLGKDIHDSARLDSFLSIFNEVMGAIRGLYFNKDYETAKAGVLEKFLPKLQLLNSNIGEKQFVLGYLTLADFVVAENSHFLERLFPEEYKTLPFLQRIRDTINNLPQVVAYYAKPTAFKGPFLPPHAVLAVEK
jgi:glutathione S-transferase